jgi:phytoene dehydrogenase-like protein
MQRSLLRRRPLKANPRGSEDRQRIVVVGSGINGLASGALLAKLGHTVQVLEANTDCIGGHARTLEIEGLGFCAGPQYVWDFNEGRIGHRVLSFLGLEQDIPFVEMDRDGFERFFVGEEKEGFDVPMGMDSFFGALIARFPAEERQLRRFYDVIKSFLECGRAMTDKPPPRIPIPPLFRFLFSTDLSLRQKIAFLRGLRWTLRELFDHCELSPEARRYLYGRSGIFGENESTVQAAIYAIATGFYHESARFPRDGFPALLEGLVSVIWNSGGSVEKGKRVVQLVKEKHRIVEVHCADGARYPCDLVISNLSPRLTCALIEGCDTKTFRYEPSSSCAACFVGLRDYDVHALLAQRNYWWQEGGRETDFWPPDMTDVRALLCMNSPTAKYVNEAKRAGGRQSLSVYIAGNYDQAREAYEGGEDRYKELKAKIAQGILSILDQRLFPGIRDHVIFAHVMTPVDIELETGAERGNMYGRRLTPDMARPIKTRHMAKNLFVVCATVGIPGIASGFRNASLLVKQLTGARVP